MRIPQELPAWMGRRCCACLSGSFAAAGVEEEGSFVTHAEGVDWTCWEVTEDYLNVGLTDYTNELPAAQYRAFHQGMPWEPGQIVGLRCHDPAELPALLGGMLPG